MKGVRSGLTGSHLLQYSWGGGNGDARRTGRSLVTLSPEDANGSEHVGGRQRKKTRSENGSVGAIVTNIEIPLVKKNKKNF